MAEERENEKYEWLDKKLNILMLKKTPGLLNNLIEKHPEVNEFNMWTPLKLVCLSYFVGPYVRIINRLKQKYKKLQIYYFDFFAGTGINKIKGRNSYFAGSPIVAIDCATNTKQYFDKLFLSDFDKKKIEALSSRLNELENHEEYSWIKDKYNTLIGDANVALSKYSDMLATDDMAQYFAFIDPYRSEVKFKNLEKLLQFEYGDVLYTLQAKSVARIVGKALKTDQLTIEKRKELEDFLGCLESEWEQLQLDKRENVKKYYMNKIKEYKKYVIDINIKGENFDYFMVFATRKEDPKWKKIIENMKREVEVRTSKNVFYSIEYLEKKYTRMTDYV